VILIFECAQPSCNLNKLHLRYRKFGSLATHLIFSSNQQVSTRSRVPVFFTLLTGAQRATPRESYDSRPSAREEVCSAALVNWC